jgi:phospholipase C
MLITAAGLLALLVSCSGGQDATSTGSPSASASASSATPSSRQTPTASASSSPTEGGSTLEAKSEQVTKLLVVMVENHSLDQMRQGMPYTFDLAQKYGYATDYKAITHPSLPNYLAIAGGQTFGVSNDDPPSDHPVTGSSVFGQAVAHHKTAALYADAMPSNCATEDSGEYAVRHNPWTYFVDEHNHCAAFDRRFTAFAGDVAAGHLPNVGMVIPDVCDDGHDCGLSTADAWFRQLMSTTFNGPDWKSGHLAVVLTADEDGHNQDNTVLTVVIHPSQSHHVVDQPLTHYSLTRLYDDVLDAPYLGEAAHAPDMAKAFALPVQ